MPAVLIMKVLLQGVTLSFYDSTADILLMSIPNLIPDHFNAYVLGFDASDTVPDQAIAIHHPSGAPAAISTVQGRCADAPVLNIGPHCFELNQADRLNVRSASKCVFLKKEGLGISALLMHMCLRWSVVHVRSGISTNFPEPNFPPTDVQPTDSTHFQVLVTHANTRLAAALGFLIVLSEGVGSAVDLASGDMDHWRHCGRLIRLTFDQCCYWKSCWGPDRRYPPH